MLILASQSPRRSELLRNAALEFQVRPANIDESILDDEEPEEHVKRLACAKAMAVESSPGEVVLGADTVVVIDGEILGKPVDDADADRMLRLLSGRKHEVITGLCLRNGQSLSSEWETTRVWFGTMTDEDIAEYVASGESLDKAGAYAIQGLASRFVEKIEGSYTNVVGLPVALLWKMLKEARKGEGTDD